VFPKGFLWGAATASYQVEGGIYNCDWAQAAAEGKVPVCGDACDHYNRYQEDFDIAKSLGHNAHRFSVEWARIEPREGEFDTEAIEHYRTVLRALHERGIEPIVTLWHWTLPIWLYEGGGVERKDFSKLFARYASHVVAELSDLCTQFSTINEPGVFVTHGYLYGCRPPFKGVRILGIDIEKDYGEKTSARIGRFSHIVSFFRVQRNLIKAHNSAYDAIKEIAPFVQVSVVKHVRFFVGNWNPFNKLLAVVAQYFQSGHFLRGVVNKLDVIGLNYYKSTHFGGTEVFDMTDIGWKVTPWEIYDALKYLERYKKPILITEAGIADARDKDRAEYIRKQVAGVARALEEGVDVRGHFYWSLLDNYEWDDGFEMKFGLVEINYETQERTIRPSAYVYKDLIVHYSK